MKTVNDYRASGGNQRAVFINDFIKAFWGNLDIKEIGDLRDKYYAINRALGDAIDKNVAILTTSYTVSHNEKKYLYEDSKAEEFAKQRMANQLVATLLNSNEVPIRKFEHLSTNDIEFRIEIPFIILKPDAIKESE